MREKKPAGKLCAGKPSVLYGGLSVSESTVYENIVGGFGAKFLALIVRLSAHDEVHPTLLQFFLTLTYRLIRGFSIRLCSGLSFKSRYYPRSGLAKNVFSLLVSFFLFGN